MKIEIRLGQGDEERRFQVDRNKARVGRALALKEIKDLKSLSQKNRTPGLFYLILVYLNRYTGEILRELDEDLLKAILEQDVLPKDEYDMIMNRRKHEKNNHTSSK